MDLYAEILAHYLQQQDAQIIFPNLQLNAKEIVEMECYRALDKIRAIIRDEQYTDENCIMKIEEIVCALEDVGSHGGIRHDEL